jgi:large subunit ribosomal protein L39e
MYKLTLKNRCHFRVFVMAARKSTTRKIRLLKKIKQNRPVPAWIIIRTHRHVRTNPKRRSWRRSDVNIG